MRLSDLSPNDILGVTPPTERKAAPKASGGMRLSDLDPSEIVDVATPGLIEAKSKPLPDMIVDTTKDVLRPVKQNIVDPVMKGLDYLAAPVRAGVGKYQSLPESMQFSPKGLGAATGEMARFAKDEITGAATPADAPSVGEIYNRSDLKRLIDRPAVTDAAGNFLLRSGPSADPTRQDPSIDPNELYDGDLAGEAKRFGKTATNFAGEMAAGGLMDPTNILLPAAGGLIKKGINVADDAARVGANALKQGYKARVAEATGSMSAAPTPPAPPKPPAKAMTSAKELSNYVKASKEAGLSTDLPEAKALERAQALTTDLRHPVLPAQKKATTNLADRDTYRTLKDSGTKTAATISEYEQLQRAEGFKKIKETIDEISPSKSAKTDELEVGEKLKNDFVSQYQAKKADLGKAFNRYDKTNIDPIEHIPFLTEKIAARAPGITDFIDVVDETATLKPFTPAMGISPVEYEALNQVVNTLNTQPLTIKQIRNIRGSLLNSFPDPLTRPPMVNAIRQGMLDHIRDLVAKKNPGKSKQVFETFKNYAINEQNLDDLEKVFGGSFSEFAQGTKNVVPERVLNRIFSNSRNAKIARKALGDEAYSEAFASYVGSKLKSFTVGDETSPRFASRRFSEWLRKNRTVLNAISPDKTKLDRLDALSTILKFTSDDLPINPSGTAKTYGLLQDVWGAVKQPTGVVDAVVGTPIKAGMAAFNNVRKNRGAANTFNRLSGEPGMLQKAFEKAVSPEQRALLKRFIQDEEGAFTPKDLQQILKPGEDNVFDLKTARGMAGEPKRGLLEPKGNPVAPIDRLSNEDLERFEQLRRKAVREGYDLTPDEAEFVKRLSESGRLKDRMMQMNMKDLANTANPDRGYPAQFDKRKKAKLSKEIEQPIEQPRGLLTSLDVERGPVTERPEAGKLINTVREDTGDAYVGGLKKGGIFKAESGPLKGQEFTVTGKSKEASEATNWDTVYEAKTRDGKSHWFNSSEMYWLQKPDTDAYGAFASPEALADKERRIKEIGADMKRRNSEMKAAEAERLKKGLIGVDFGGRGGKVPKAKPSGPAIGEVWSGPSGKKYTVLASETEGGKTYVKVEHVDVSGGPSDGKKITTWEEADDPKIFYGLEKRGESGPKGKKELVDALMSGEMKVPGISIKRGKENPNQGLIDDLWANREKPSNTPVDIPLGGRVSLKKSMSNSMESGKTFEVVEALDDEPGYLLYDADTGKTFSVQDSDISQVFSDKGKPVKPKGGKGKPKKKKD